MRVLLSAFACGPDKGSEPGFGWNWALCLAQRGLHVTVITREVERRNIEAYLAAHDRPNLQFIYFSLSPWTLRLPGGLQYLFWQSLVVKVAKKAHRERPFDVVHHVTYGSIHVPTQLWKLGVPTVFGPVGGGQTAPPSMLDYFGRDRRNEEYRTLLTKVLRHSPLHRYWLKQMRVVLAANGETLDLLHALGKQDAAVEYDVGIPSEYLSAKPKSYELEPGPARLIWVARMLPRKALPLALDAFAKTRHPATLTIVGSGLPEATVEAMVTARGLTGRVHWAGRRLTVKEVRAAYQEHDAMLFTSLRDTCGVQLLEAMAVGLPTITLDLHGAKSLIPSGGGIKVPVTTIPQVVLGLAGAIDKFSEMSLAEKDAMSRSNWEFAKTCTWTSRAEKAESIYRRIVDSTATYS